jgi:predicted amino acid racemase
MTPFESDQVNGDFSPGQRGFRALVSVGHLDTEITGLTPINSNYHIAGASSDVTVVNVGDDQGGLNVGDTIKFRLNYAALLRLMSGKYIEKVVTPSLDKFENILESELLEVETAVDIVAEDNLRQ